MNNKSKVQNPLTIIAIFAGIAEIAGTTVLIGLPIEIQRTFVWFVMLFPFVLIVLFFLVLLFKHGVLYAPSDFTDESNFIGILKNRSNKINNELTEATSEIVEAKKLIDALEEAKKQLEESTAENIYSTQIKELSKKLNSIQNQVENAMQTNKNTQLTNNIKLHKKNNGKIVSTTIKNILEEIEESGFVGITIGEIEKITGYSKEEIVTALYSLRIDGSILSDGNRYYRDLRERAL
ncbi:hypothetical protein RQP50_27595 [Paenibacillus sp. chi10]|uniref:Uncharacterized protein n=1 Tax=Paenibacillus suaedae TaxID=3077233 RepID=A0AAJ2K243_9BACL|nr:hypothetical protein [Paenibacillus sp. chi10]MDT8979999.1 hypothetical protein [Paenibacillus sp. chi10]